MRVALLICAVLWCATLTRAQATDELFIEVSVDEPAPYVGQALVYTVRVRSTVPLDTVRIIEPSFTSLGRSADVQAPQTTNETSGDQALTVTTQAIVLYPLRSGAIEIEPYRIVLPQTPFTAAQTITSAAVQLNIRDLPSPPPSFSNAIGQFEVTARAEPTEITVGEAITFQLAVTGSGNIERVRPPRLDLPEAWQAFEQPGQFQRDNLLVGTRLFTWSLLPSSAEISQIPPIAFSFFEPQTQQYSTRRTRPIPITITEADTINDIATDSAPPIVALPPSQAPPLRPLPTTAVRLDVPLSFWLLWLLAPSIYVIVWLSYGRHKVQDDTPVARSARGTARRTNRALHRIDVDDPQTSYAAIQDALLQYISQKTGKRITIDALEPHLIHLPEKLRAAYLACLQEAAAGSYAPLTSVDVERLRDRSKKVIAALDKVTWP